MTHLGDMLRIWRSIHKIGLRQLADDTGISAPTLSRFENGGPLDGKSALKLVDWLLQETT